MLTDKAIEGYKRHTEKTISHAQYRLGSTWYTVQISRRERLPDGRVAVYFPIIPQAPGQVTISGVRLYDTDNARKKAFCTASRSTSMKRRVNFV